MFLYINLTTYVSKNASWLERWSERNILNPSNIRAPDYITQNFPCHLYCFDFALVESLLYIAVLCLSLITTSFDISLHFFLVLCFSEKRKDLCLHCFKFFFKKISNIQSDPYIIIVFRERKD